MAKSSRPKRKAAKSKRASPRPESKPKSTASPSPVNAGSAEYLAENAPNHHSKKDAVQSAEINRGMRKASRMSVFISILFLAVAGVLFGIAVAHWQKDSYVNFRLAMWWGVAGYVVFGVGAVFTYYSNVIEPAKNAAKQPQPTAEASAKTLSLADRPYIAIQKAKLSNIEVGKKPVAEWLFENAGKTPAHNVSFYGWLVLAVRPLPEDAPYPAEGNKEVGKVFLQAGGVQQGRVEADWIIEAHEMEAVNNKTMGIYFLGFCTYDDEAGDPHKLRFCGMYNPSIPSQISPCPTHNSSN